MQSNYDPDIVRHRRERLALLCGVLTTLILFAFAGSFLHHRGLVLIPGLPTPPAPATPTAPQETPATPTAATSPTARPPGSPAASSWEIERARLLSPSASAAAATAYRKD